MEGCAAMATQKMLTFVSTPREMPEKRAAAERAEDFHEIYREYAAAKAGIAAAREAAVDGKSSQEEDVGE